MQNCMIRHELFFLHPTQNHKILLVLQVKPKKIVIIFCLICFLVAQQIWPCDFTKENQEFYQHHNLNTMNKMCLVMFSF
jgi:predicted RND superfamily exporter protein